MIEKAAPRWPRPLLNRPDRIGNLDRDKLYRLLTDIPGLDIPATVHATRAQLSDSLEGPIACADFAGELHFPMIVRPRGTHAGVGLAKVDDAAALAAYLAERQEQDFFVARFVDYVEPRRALSQIPARHRRRPALCLPHGDRRSLGHLVSQRLHGVQRGEARRRSRLHARLRSCLRSAPQELRSTK